MKMKMFISIVAAMLSITMFAEDTPLVQAMKTRDKIEEIREAIARRGVECQSFDAMPQAISQISYINEFLNGDGEYRGPIVLTKNFNTKAFQNLNGEFDLQLLGNTSIAAEQFMYAYGLRYVTAPNVTTIASSGFRYSNITNVTMPNLTSIGTACFANSKLTGIVELPKLTTLNSDSFAYTSIQELKTNNGFTSIPNSAFDHATSLTNINISQDSCTFGSWCFSCCYALQHITCPNSFSFNSGSFAYSGITNATEFLQKVTTLGPNEIFRGCSKLKDVRSDSLLLLTDRLLFAESAIENVDFPALKTIWNATYNYGEGGIFANCKRLKYVNMPALEAICTAGVASYYQDNLFYNCSSLEEIEFPALKIIGTQNGCGLLTPFKYCTKLRSARFPSLEFLKFRGQYADTAFFSYCYKLVDLQMPALKIMHCASTPSMFIGECHSLKKVNLPNLTDLFHNKGFISKCPALREIYMPSLTNIVSLNGWVDVTPAPGTGTKNIATLFAENPLLTDVTLGVKATTLKAMTGFPSGAPDTCVFHCPADAPNDVTIVKRNGTWEIVNNGTYQLADYLEGTGTQYINTGYIHGTNTVVEIIFSLKPQAIPAYQTIFGSRNGTSGTSQSYAFYSVYNSKNQFSYMRNQTVNGSLYELNDETVYKVVCSNNTCRIYNQFDELLQQITTTAVANKGVGPLAIFTLNQSSTAGGYSPNTANAVKNMKLLRFTLKEDGEVVQDLLPGVRSDGVGCLLDAANNWHPLFNCGTGNFNYGSITNCIPTGN